MIRIAGCGVDNLPMECVRYTRMIRELRDFLITLRKNFQDCGFAGGCDCGRMQKVLIRSRRVEVDVRITTFDIYYNGINK
jgi:hypothetical protein